MTLRGKSNVSICTQCRESLMKCFTVWVLIIVLSGCTTLRPISAAQPDLSLDIASGKILKVGDHLVIGTRDRQTYEFEVISFSATSIDGKGNSIPIDQVVSLEKRVVNGKKTLIVLGSILLGVAFTVALAHAFQEAAGAALFRGSN
jgi:hypothetical protein